jgi:hypothetical protein
MPDTAPCSKCGSSISTSVEKCPECGYEPSAGWVLNLLSVVAGLVALVVVVFLLVVWVMALGFQLGFFSAIVSTLLSLVLLVPSGVVLYFKFKTMNQTLTRSS